MEGIKNNVKGTHKYTHTNTKATKKNLIATMLLIMEISVRYNLINII